MVAVVGRVVAACGVVVETGGAVAPAVDAAVREREGVDAAVREREGVDAAVREREGVDAAVREREGVDAAVREREGVVAAPFRPPWPRANRTTRPTAAPRTMTAARLAASRARGDARLRWTAPRRLPAAGRGGTGAAPSRGRTRPRQSFVEGTTGNRRVTEADARCGPV